MIKKIKITERQLKAISDVVLMETNSNVRLKNSIHDFLERDYKPAGGVKEIANEYYDTGLVKKKIDGSMITPQALSEYLQHKFSGVSTKELNDCIEGWYYGDYDRETGMRKKN